MRLSIGFITGRPEPHLDWVVDDLIKQMQTGDEIELLVVDALGPRELVDEDRARAHGITVRSSPVHPNIWQGPYRVTSRDWWAMAASRNTAFVLATTGYIAFLDDRCHLGPEWLETVRHGFNTRESVICGAYEKHEDGKITRDHRLTHAPNGMRRCGGQWLYGCTFALPLEWALNVNGFEEGMDGLSFEDVIFGMNLAHAGYRLDYVPSLFISEERGIAQASQFRRTDKGTSPTDKSHAALHRFGSRMRTDPEFTPDLRALRKHVQGGGDWPVPDKTAQHRDWFDGQLVSEMT